MAAGLRQTFGRYIARESAVHDLQPPAKMLVFALLLASVLLSSTWAALAVAGAYTAGLCILSRVRLTFYLAGLKYFSWMFALSFAVNVAFPREAAHEAFSPEALGVAAIYAVRLGLMILAGTLFTVTTAPHELGDGLLAFGGARGRLGRKAADLATILSIALRFVPVMFEEAERIRTAQMLRGQRARGLGGRVRAVVNLIVPLLQSSLRKATDLGYALESRCYGYMVPAAEGLHIRSGEAALLAASAGCLTVVVLMRAGLR